MDKLMNRSENIGSFVPMPDDDMIVCRCEEITKGEIRWAVHDGFRSLTEIKRVLRNGMGLCQGQTCSRLVRSIVARELGGPSVGFADDDIACTGASGGNECVCKGGQVI